MFLVRWLLVVFTLVVFWLSQGAPSLLAEVPVIKQLDSEAANHYVPADKQLTNETKQTLFARGERKEYRGDELFTLGMPCGGVAAGQLYVRGDGTLARWWIFNEPISTHFRHKMPNTGYSTYRPPSRLLQGFAISAKQAGKDAQALVLSEEGFEDIRFIGEYPIATIKYQGAKQDDWPLEIQSEVYSPYTPLDAKDSALPATILRYTVSNPTDQPISVKLGGWLQNGAMPNADDSMKAKGRNRTVQCDNYVGVAMDVISSVPQTSKPGGGNRSQSFDDFEGDIVNADGTADVQGSLDKWQATGNAFAATATPIAGEDKWLAGFRGYQGKHVVVSNRGGKEATGTLTSDPFEIQEPYIGFRVGGDMPLAQKSPNLPNVRLMIDGKAVRTTPGVSSRGMVIKSWDVRDLIGKQATLQIVDEDPAGLIVVDDFTFSNFDPVRGTPLESQKEYGNLLLATLEKNATATADWGSGKRQESQARFTSSLTNEAAEVVGETTFALDNRTCGAVVVPIELAAGEKRTVTFVISWYFPNYENTSKGAPGKVGRMYTNWFGNSQEVANYLTQNFDRLNRVTHQFRDAMYLDTTLPYWLVQRSMAPNANLASATVEWWKNGRFYSWEGVGFCLGTCGHVWNYAQGPARLFPELERSVRNDQDFHPKVAWKETGRINFRGYNDKNDETFKSWGYIPDAQAGYVLKAYREHLMSADNAFLGKLYPRVKRSMKYLIERDGRYGETNGVLEGLQHLTDSLAWGPNTFTGLLYLAALRSAEEMATTQGDTEFAEQCRALYETGRDWTLTHLWNGQYFAHLYSPAPPGGLPGDQKGRAFGNGCLSDQMFGQNWSHQLGLGYIYPPKKVKHSLASVYKYNWAPDVAEVYEKRRRRFIVLANSGEAGLMGCTFPFGAPRNLIDQNEDPWTGYEYQAASGMIWEGMLEEGLAIAYGVHERYDGAKHNPWNEIEGGDHYSRSMAAWGMLLAISGYEYDGPAGKIGFAPRMQADNFKCLFTAAEGWGSLVQTRKAGYQQSGLKLRWGKLKVQTLTFEVPEGVTVRALSINKEATSQSPAYRQEGNRVIVTLKEPVTLVADQSTELTVKMAW